MGQADRYVGALLGVHAGDCLGATVEFSSYAAIRREYPDGVRAIVGGGPFDWPPGHATDDTDLTRAVLVAYLADPEDFVRAAADLMVDWYEGRWPDRSPGSRPVDVGNATAAGLHAYLRSGDPRRAGAGAEAAGNGSLMRAIPTALARRTREERVRDAVEISAITHDDPRCTAACAAYVEMTAALLAGDQPDVAVEAGRAVGEDLGAANVVKAIGVGQSVDLAHAARTGVTQPPVKGTGYVLDSLSLAVAAVLDPRSLEDVLVDVVRLGGDSDTNGAIAGGLLGARDGASAIPAHWLERLQFRDEFTAAGARLAAG